MIRKQDIQLFLFTDNMIAYTKYSQGISKKFLEIISEFSKVTGKNVNTLKSIILLYSSNKDFRY